MSFEISQMTDAAKQNWAKKCDANFDGKIDENEQLVFQQGADSMYKCGDANRDRVVIDGVSLFVDDLKTIKKNEEGSKFDYAVEFNSGIKAQFDRQNDDNEAGINSSNFNITPFGSNSSVETETHAFNIADGDGIEITGTRKDDFIEVRNSKISSINAKSGVDRVDTDGCIGTTKNSIIHAEDSYIRNSADLTIKHSGRKILRPTNFDEPINITKENPNYTSPSIAINLEKEHKI